MTEPARSARVQLKPPITNVGGIGWLRTNLFNTWYNSILTVATLLILAWLVPPLFRWTLVDSLWNSTSEACRDIDGACWSVIPNNIRFIIFGFFPEGQAWRPGLAMLLLLSLVIYSREWTRWKKSLGWIWLCSLIVMGALMYGGIFGMPVVETAQWSGLP